MAESWLTNSRAASRRAAGPRLLIRGAFGFLDPENSGQLVLKGGYGNDLGRLFQISAVGATQTSFQWCSAGGAHLAAERDRPDLTVGGLARESDRWIPLRSRKGGVR